jgi:hypothetical protein
LPFASPQPDPENCPASFGADDKRFVSKTLTIATYVNLFFLLQNVPGFSRAWRATHQENLRPS